MSRTCNREPCRDSVDPPQMHSRSRRQAEDGAVDSFAMAAIELEIGCIFIWKNGIIPNGFLANAAGQTSSTTSKVIQDD